jgi:Icc-related predicted phosphoesterase
MRQFLICGGVHGERRSLDWMRTLVETKQPDGVLFVGGVLSPARKYTARATPWGMTRDDGLLLEEFFETLGGLDVFAAVIPGRMDTPVEEFLRLGMHAEIEYPNLHVVHATLVTQGDLAVCGMGGNLCEGAACEIDSCSRVMTEYGLRPLWSAPQPRKALLLSSPPTGFLGGQEGSSLTDELIDSWHPSVCVATGTSDARGVTRTARTLVINPGHLADGWAAWLDWGRAVKEQVEFLSMCGERAGSAEAVAGS